MVFNTIRTIGEKALDAGKSILKGTTDRLITGPIAGVRQTIAHAANAVVQPINAVGHLARNTFEFVDGGLEALSHLAVLRIRQATNVAAASALAFTVNTGKEVGGDAVRMGGEIVGAAGSAVGTPFRVITGNTEVNTSNENSGFSTEYNARRHAA